MTEAHSNIQHVPERKSNAQGSSQYNARSCSSSSSSLVWVKWIGFAKGEGGVTQWVSHDNTMHEKWCLVWLVDLQTIFCSCSIWLNGLSYVLVLMSCFVGKKIISAFYSGQKWNDSWCSKNDVISSLYMSYWTIFQQNKRENWFNGLMLL